MSIKSVNMVIATTNKLAENYPLGECRFMAISTYFSNRLVENVFNEFGCSTREEAIKIVKDVLGNYTDEQFEKMLMDRDILVQKNIALESELKDWYDKNYSSDSNNISESATFLLLMSCLENGIKLDTIGIDVSVVRERLFEGLAEILECEYNVIYDKWVNNLDTNLKKSFNLESIYNV